MTKLFSMKKLILLALTFLSFNSNALEILRPEGRYKFKSIEVAQVRDVEIVPQRNKERYLELVEQRFQCFLVGQFYKCQKHVKNVELPVNLKNKLTKDLKGKSFEFTLSTMEPAIISEADGLDEWLIFDTVQYDGEQINEYHFYHLKGLVCGVQKALITFEKSPQWPVIVDENTIYTPIQKIISTGTFTTRVFELSQYFAK
jgi:hypothetical protein